MKERLTRLFGYERMLVLFSFSQVTERKYKKNGPIKHREVIYQNNNLARESRFWHALLSLFDNPTQVRSKVC